jgi:hypothetical protein
MADLLPLKVRKRWSNSGNSHEKFEGIGSGVTENPPQSLKTKGVSQIVVVRENGSGAGHYDLIRME